MAPTIRSQSQSGVSEAPQDLNKIQSVIQMAQRMVDTMNETP